GKQTEGDIVRLKCAGGATAQHEVGAACCADRGDARELVIRADRADGRGAGELVVANVVNLQCAGRAAAQQEIAFAGDATEIVESQDRKVRSHRAQRGRICDVVVHNVIDLECAGGGVAQQHVAGIAIVEAAERDKLKRGSDFAQLKVGQDPIISDV